MGGSALAVQWTRYVLLETGDLQGLLRNEGRRERNRAGDASRRSPRCRHCSDGLVDVGRDSARHPVPIAIDVDMPPTKQFRRICRIVSLLTGTPTPRTDTCR